MIGGQAAARLNAPCKHSANMLANNVASSCHNAKSRARGVKQLPLVASSCRRARQVRTPSSPPYFSITFTLCSGPSEGGVSVAVSLASVAVSLALLSSLATNSIVCCLMSGDRCSYPTRTAVTSQLADNGLTDSTQEQDGCRHLAKVVNTQALKLFARPFTRSLETVADVPTVY